MWGRAGVQVVALAVDAKLGRRILALAGGTAGTALWQGTRLVARSAVVTARVDWGMMRFSSGFRNCMTIDIDRLTETERIDLNHRIVARLRLLHQMRAHSEMLEFRNGDRVAFRPSGHGLVEGAIVRYNRNTVTVVTSEGRRWNVSPNLRSRVVSSEAARSGNGSLRLPGER